MEVARPHAAPFAPVAVEFGEVAVEEHPAAGDAAEAFPSLPGTDA